PLGPFDAEEGRRHPGYFWLAYEWRNLVLACQECTDGKPDGHPGTRHEFPVKGVRLWERPADPYETWGEALVEEEPLVVHPYDPDVWDHFAFDDGGYLIPLTEKGRETVRVCGLNRRALRRAREQAKEKKYRSAWLRMKRGGVPPSEEF